MKQIPETLSSAVLVLCVFAMLLSLGWLIFGSIGFGRKEDPRVGVFVLQKLASLESRVSTIEHELDEAKHDKCQTKAAACQAKDPNANCGECLSGPRGTAAPIGEEK